MKYKTYYIGCTDFYGNNDVGDFLNVEIANVCKKYKVSEKDFDKIAKAFTEACKKAYSNGGDNFECEANEWV